MGTWIKLTRDALYLMQENQYLEKVALEQLSASSKKESKLNLPIRWFTRSVPAVPGTMVIDWSETAPRVDELIAPANKNPLSVPYLNQHDNAIDPHGTCNVTCIAMVLKFYKLGPDVANNEQLEDKLEREMRNKGLDRHVHDHLSRILRGHGVSNRFTTTATWQDVKEHISSGHPVIVAGDFTFSGHILVVTGYTDQGFIINDPNGECLGEQGRYDENDPSPNSLSAGREKGKGIVYSNSLMNRLAGPDGNVWAHFPMRI